MTSNQGRCQEMRIIEIDIFFLVLQSILPSIPGVGRLLALNKVKRINTMVDYYYFVASFYSCCVSFQIYLHETHEM